MGLRRTANESAPQTSDGLEDFFFNVNGYSVLPRLGSGTALSATSAMPFQNAVFNYFTSVSERSTVLDLWRYVELEPKENTRSNSAAKLDGTV